MPRHNVPLVVLGTFILAFGWFGFNPGSTLAGTDLRISFVVVHTMLAGVVASLVSMVTLMLKGLKPDPTMCCNGMLAGLGKYSVNPCSPSATKAFSRKSCYKGGHGTEPATSPHPL